MVTGLPAKYFDPATQCPFANLYAYTVLKDLQKQKQAAKTIDSEQIFLVINLIDESSIKLITKIFNFGYKLNDQYF